MLKQTCKILVIQNAIWSQKYPKTMWSIEKVQVVVQKVNSNVNIGISDKIILALCTSTVIFNDLVNNNGNGLYIRVQLNVWENKNTV